VGEVPFPVLADVEEDRRGRPGQFGGKLARADLGDATGGGPTDLRHLGE